MLDIEKKIRNAASMIFQIKKSKNKIKTAKYVFSTFFMTFLGIFSKNSGKYIYDLEWDTIVILDACRYDIFEEVITKFKGINGKLTHIESRGSHTYDWIKNNFSHKEKYNDLVVVAGNPHYSNIILKRMLGKNPFFHVEQVWQYDWDEMLETVHPAKVTDAAINMRKKYPNKRMIIHYMQPHHPFITTKLGCDSKLAGAANEKNIIMGSSDRTIWEEVVDGSITVEEVKSAQKEDLKLVLKEIKRLIPNLNGKVVISADHGDCYGEYGLYAHPGGCRIAPLIKVPWFEVKYAGEKK